MPTGTALDGLRAELLSEPNARTVLRWLANPDLSDMLTRLASSKQITHEALDDLPQTGALRYLRGLLVEIGSIPQRNEPLERTAVWLSERFDQVPGHHMVLVRPFAEWTLLRRARRRAAVDKFTHGSAKYLRQRVNVALHFLSWLETHGRDLEHLRQQDVDLYLASGSTRRYIVRDFIRWSIRHRHAPTALTVPMRQQLVPTNAYDDDARWAHVRLLVHDEKIPAAARVAGALVLVYGQHLSRIVTWKLDRVDVDEGRVCIRLNRTPVDIAEPVAGLVRNLLETRRGHARAGRHGDWLFPGAIPGQHVDAETLRKVLAERHIVLREARNAALGELATDVPAAVLSTLLGLHINTADRWSRSMQSNWTDFVAASLSNTDSVQGVLRAGHGPTRSARKTD